MHNATNNFGFYGFQHPIQSLGSFSQMFCSNFDQIPNISYFYFDQNLILHQAPIFLTFDFGNIPQCLASNFDQTQSFMKSHCQQNIITQVKTLTDQLHFHSQISKYTPKSTQIEVKTSGAFSFYQTYQQNEKLGSLIFEKGVEKTEKFKNQSSIQFVNDEKKIIQNLRYQRKNIEANIVNKIYTHLKTILKFGQKSVHYSALDKERSVNYLKVLEKLEKAKKQTIKREFLRSLTCMNESLQGFNKIDKELQKKGLSIQQFEYYIRVIIRNYLRNQAMNSILTSKKMNPSLWIDHLKKVRELETYIFSGQQIQQIF